MRRLFLFTIAMLVTSMAMAIPAHPGKTVIRQPDGSTVTVRLHGDEYLHFQTTDDGYSIVQRADGYYVYALLDSGGQLQPTSFVAHDTAQRTATEQAWLMNVAKYQAPQMSEQVVREQQAEFDRRAKARAAAVSHAPQYDYNNFRGLILLVQFNDKEFSRADYPSIVDDMANKENYTGYSRSGAGIYTGSVRDYFYDNSNGVFTPQFDVVGPINIDYSQYDPKATENAGSITLAALEAADPIVDYSLYDGDKDGVVDMIYFIFAGVGSNIEGNDQRLIWPHASYIYRQNGRQWETVVMDNISMGRYACSTELYGSSSNNIIDGIGVICHEFTHVLGLMDHYDTDYEGGGGQSHDPEDWDLMAGGGYLNNGRTPTGYNLYEKWSVGFDANLQTISEEGSYELQDLGTSHAGYRLNTPVKKEFFIMENRQKTSKWDRYLPGHGMLVWRVDSTNSSVWVQNRVNCNPKHNYFVLLRAGGSSSGANASDPFPGSRNVTQLNNNTSPANLKTWTGQLAKLGLEDIKESNGVISFDVVDVNILKSVTLPETATVGKLLNIQLTETRYPDMAPYTLQWSSSDEKIATVDQNGMVTGVETGEADITVVANGDQAISAVCHVTVEEVTFAGSIAEYLAMGTDQQRALLLNDALVLYTYENDAYVRDATGTLLFADCELGIETGDKLNGYIFGQLAVVNSMPRFEKVGISTNAQGFTVSKGEEPVPREVNIEELTESDYGDLITLKAVPLKSDGGIWAYGGEKQLRLWNKFQLSEISVPTKYQGKYFDITGIYTTDLLKGNVIDELALTGNLVEVEPKIPEEIDAIATDGLDADSRVIVYTADGRQVAVTTVGDLSRITLKQGIYVVKAGQKAWQFAK